MQTTTATATTVKAAINLIYAIAESIRELGEVPSGTLYAQVMGVVSIDDYNRVLGVLKGANLIAEDGFHLIRWIGPKVAA